MSGTLVTVTGAAGFIASHLVAQLLERGFRVRGTVRSMARPEHAGHLRALPGASDRLELVEADLLVPGAFDAAVRDASCVMHTASPYVLDVGDAQRDLVEPAVEGTRHVLRACAAAPSVRRVIVTSSVAAVTDEPVTDHVFTEADWNTKSTLHRNPYYFSKTLAEKAAWHFHDEVTPPFDLVVINPAMVIGPSLSAAINTSNQVFVDLLKGTFPGVLSLAWSLVDVRDVALAHVLAMETPGARGRYLCAAETLPMREVIAIARDAGYGSGKLPRVALDHPVGDVLVRLVSYLQPAGVGSYVRTHLGAVPRFDNRKIQRELGLRFRDVRTSIVETLADLERRGHVTGRQRRV